MLVKFKHIKEMAAVPKKLVGNMASDAKYLAYNKKVRGEHEELVDHYKKVGNPDQIKAIQNYTASGSKSLNKKLYTGKKLTKREQYVHKHLSDHIQSNKTPKSLVVHTGVKRSPEHSKKSGDSPIKAELPAFTSTSLDYTIANHFSGPDHKSEHKYDLKRQKTAPGDKKGWAYGHVISIHVPKGSHGSYVSGHSYMGNEERELVLHPNSKLHINPTPDVHHDTKVVQWHAKLVHDGVSKKGKK